MDGYFEGILQLRPAKPEIVGFIQQVVAKAEKNGVLLTDVKEKKEGLDFYLASNTFLIALGKRLQKEFGGQTVLSKKLHTKNRQTGKLVHRLTLLFRAPLFTKGMLVLDEQDVIKITNVQKKISGKSIISGKRVLVKNPKELTTATTMVITTHPVLQVLHPFTYQPTVVANSCNVKKDSIVDVALHGDNVYVIA